MVNATRDGAPDPTLEVDGRGRVVNNWARGGGDHKVRQRRRVVASDETRLRVDFTKWFGLRELDDLDVASDVDAARGDHLGPHAHGVATLLDHVAQDVKLALEAIGLCSRGHHAAGARSGHANDGVTEAKLLANPLPTRRVLARVEHDVRSKSADVPLQIGSMTLEKSEVGRRQKVQFALVDEGVPRALPAKGPRLISFEVLGAFEGPNAMS